MPKKKHSDLNQKDKADLAQNFEQAETSVQDKGQDVNNLEVDPNLDEEQKTALFVRAGQIIQQDREWNDVSEPVLFKPKSDDLSKKDDAVKGTEERTDYSFEEIVARAKTSGELLRFHRQRLGYSAAFAAKLIKIRPDTIVDIELDRLTKETDSDYVHNLIKAYAKILGIDPQCVLDKYNQTRNEKITISKDTEQNKPVDRYMSRNFILIICILLIAVIGFFVFSDENRESKTLPDKGAISLGSNDQSNNLPKMVSGSIDENGNIIEEQQVVIEDKKNTQASEVKYVDLNTSRANAQKQALNTSTSVENTIEQEELNNTDTLLLAKENPDQLSKEQLSADIVLSKKNQAEALAKAEKAKKDAEIAQKVNDTLAAAPVNIGNQDNVLAAVANKSTKVEEDTIEQNVALEIGTLEAKVQDKKAEKPEVVEVKLDKKLKNVSSKISIKDREGLASLNSLQINVSKDVALKISDGTGKVLKSGVFKSNENIKLTGIPPFKIAVSDTTAVSISYMGGTVVKPDAKQVEFELPMR